MRTDKQKFYDSGRWRKVRSQILRETPLCVRCNSIGLIVAATMVDHVLGFIDKHDEMATDSSNLVPLCTHCHGTVTSFEKRGLIDGLTLEEAKKLKYVIREIDSDGYPIG